MNIKEKKKRQRERIIILVLIPLLAFLIYLEGHSFKIDLGLPNSLLFFFLLNINIILLLLLAFLVFRNLVKLIAERKKGVIGSKIRTKLVILFISLAMLPTLVLFGISVKFAISTFNYWLNLKIEKALNQAIQVGKSYYDQTTQNLLVTGERVTLILKSHTAEEQNTSLVEYLRGKNVDLVQIYSEDGQIIWTFIKKEVPPKLAHLDFRKTFEEVVKKRQRISSIEPLPEGDLVYVVFPIYQENLKEFLILAKLIPAKLVKGFEGIRASVEEYKQVALFIKPLKMSVFVIFSIITLLVLFAATWIGFHLAKVITAPIQTLAAATQEVASGNLNIQVDVTSEDELGMLVQSFNKMIMDLKEAYEQLSQQKAEIEKRHKYIETILENIKTGVISTDASGRITTINPAAANILGHIVLSCIGQNLECLNQISPCLKEAFMEVMQKEIKEKQLHIILNNRRINLLISSTLLQNKKGLPLGHVFVFEDITELEKMQRMAAWREVARRIAHEIKNPLTPIQLSAQRLRRRYLDQIQDKGVFDECTQMIIKQVDGLKKMVNEFSQFARLPTINPIPNNLATVIEEAISVYKNARPEISFSFQILKHVPIFAFDREQIKRVFLNLIDNAIASMEGKGRIEITCDYDEGLKIARVEVKDTGKGIPAEHKPYLFEPYFSTKKSGTGLGLTIVHQIVSDHQGFIRVKDNYPQGTIFVVELPVQA